MCVLSHATWCDMIDGGLGEKQKGLLVSELGGVKEE
jgi:hypothetical protein